VLLVDEDTIATNAIDPLRCKFKIELVKNTPAGKAEPDMVSAFSNFAGPYKKGYILTAVLLSFSSQSQEAFSRPIRF